MLFLSWTFIFDCSIVIVAFLILYDTLAVVFSCVIVVIIVSTVIMMGSSTTTIIVACDCCSNYIVLLRTGDDGCGSGIGTENSSRVRICYSL